MDKHIHKGMGSGRDGAEEELGAKLRQNDSLELEPSSFTQQPTQTTPLL
jgi:hypothetical protein